MDEAYMYLMMLSCLLTASKPVVKPAVMQPVMQAANHNQSSQKVILSSVHDKCPLQGIVHAVLAHMHNRKWAHYHGPQLYRWL
jgi:hypothetical protein